MLVVAFLLPLFDTLRGLIENGDASRHLQRTPQGEQEAECVYGIRNYLRDLTAISDADRKALVLWDDFFVYAVALGQNPRAVNELLRVWKEHDERGWAGVSRALCRIEKTLLYFASSFYLCDRMNLTH